MIEDIEIRPGDLRTPGPIKLPGRHDGVFDDAALDIIRRQKAIVAGRPPIFKRLRIPIEQHECLGPHAVCDGIEF
jgi:hypothetical protein